MLRVQLFLKQKMNNVILYNLCMIRDRMGNLLVQKRSRGLKGYTFPGGKIEPNESIKESVIREVHEETGLVIAEPIFKALVSFYEQKTGERREIFLYYANNFSGNLIPENSEGEYFWCSMEDFMRLPMVDGMSEFLKAYQNDKFEWHYNE